MAKTKADLQAELDERGIAHPEDATVAQLQELLDAAPAAGATGADVATGAQHPTSIVEPLPDEEKAGPASIQSREIRPDEQDLAPGTSALQGPRDD